MAQRWTFIAKGSNWSGVANPVPAIPAGVQTNDLLVILAVSGVAYSTTPPAGWQIAIQNTTAAPFLTLYYRTATSAETSPTLTNASTATGAAMFCFRNVQPAAPDAIGTIQSTSSTTTVTTGTSVSTQPDDLVFNPAGGGFTASGTATWSIGGGGSSGGGQNASTTVYGFQLFYEDAANPGTTTSRTVTASATLTALNAAQVLFRQTVLNAPPPASVEGPGRKPYVRQFYQPPWPYVGQVASTTAISGLAFGGGTAIAAMTGAGAMAGLATAVAPVDGAIKGAGVLSGKSTATGFAYSGVLGSAALAGSAFSTAYASLSLTGQGVMSGTAFSVGPVLGVLTGTAPGSASGISLGAGYALATISYAQGPITPTSQPGGSGKKRLIKRSSEVLAEELAKLERQVTEATEQRVEAEEKLAELPADHWAISPEQLLYIADFERALRRAQEKEKREQPIDIPVYVRLPKKSAGVQRVEAYSRLKTLTALARHREQVASERLRKVRERIDFDAATALMLFLMWDE